MLITNDASSFRRRVRTTAKSLWDNDINNSTTHFDYWGVLLPAVKMAWSKSTRITIMLAIDAAFFVLELGVGLLVGSLALMADAFHMVRKTAQIVIKNKTDMCLAE